MSTYFCLFHSSSEFKNVVHGTNIMVFSNKCVVKFYISDLLFNHVDKLFLKLLLIRPMPHPFVRPIYLINSRICMGSIIIIVNGGA